jgi:hypothetical protein
LKNLETRIEMEFKDFLNKFQINEATYILALRSPLKGPQLKKATMFTIACPIDSVFYMVWQKSMSLHREDSITGYIRPWNDRNPKPATILEELHCLLGYAKRVRVLSSAKGARNS